MSLSNKITRIVFICLWAVAGSGAVVLLIAAVKSRKNQVCTGYEVSINGELKGVFFIDKSDVVNLLTRNKTVDIKNRSIASFNLADIEKKLETEAWIKNADLYFDNNGVLKVGIEEREPVARIFATNGESFYIDSTGQRLPLSSKMSARVPVFTDFPQKVKKGKAAPDRALLKQIRAISVYLLQNPFWMAQIAQIDITAERNFEMIPTIGNHVIEFGDGNDCDKKFNRLFVFYKQVLSKTGMEKYKRLKVQYDQEIIGVRDEPVNPVTAATTRAAVADNKNN